MSNHAAEDCWRSSSDVICVSVTQAPGPTEVICENVRNIRRQRGWSARELAERCRAAGLPKWNREIVANVENGRRASISVDELFVLAVVFGVAPLSLCVPLRQSAYAVTPQITMHPWRAAQWISGTADGPIGADDADPKQRDLWTSSTIPVHVYQRLDSLVSAFLDAERAYQIAEQTFSERSDGLPPEIAELARKHVVPNEVPAQYREEVTRLAYFGQRAEHLRTQLDIHRNSAGEALKYVVLSGLPAPEDLVSIADRLPNSELFRESRAVREGSFEGGERADSQDS